MPESADGALHPDDQVTASYLDGSLPAAARDRFETHLSACDSCRAGAALLASTSVSGASGEPDDEPVPPEFIARARQPRRSAGYTPGGRRGLAAAAALLTGFLALATMVLVWSPRSRDGERFADDPAYRGKEASPFGQLRPGAGAVVPLDNLVFFWSPVAGADRYVVSVINAEGETLAAIEVAGDASSVSWPAGLEPPAGGPLAWRIKALALDRLVAESRPIPFEAR